MEGIITSKSYIISAIACWVIRQSPYDFPLNLEKALMALSKRIDEKNLCDSKTKGDIDSQIELEYDNLVSLIQDLIYNTPEVSIWNVTKSEQDMGFTKHDDPKRPVKFAGTSRYGKMQPLDYSFIDLSALCRNVCKMLTEE